VVDTSVQGITAPSAVYEIGGRRFEVGSRGLAEAIADAHATHQRPRCMCLRSGNGQGVEMYVARLGDGYIVKRMPDTGSHHAPDCPSYEPPAEFSGLGQVLGSAITEDPATGETTLKLDFSLTKMPGRCQMPPAGGDSDSVATDGTKLSLRGLLHYLWDQAELTRWQPGFAGKRTWATVRWHLLHAAEHKIARGGALRTRLYIPEVFSVEHRDTINARRLAQWAHAVARRGKPRPLMLLIAEVKEIVPARYGYKAIIKHVPDQALALDERLFRRLERRFERELYLWGASEGLHMIAIATFGVSPAGVPTVEELSLMPTTAQWIPVEDAFDLQLVDRLVHEGRCFTRGLRYNMRSSAPLVSASLLDTHGGPCALTVARTSEGAVAVSEPDSGVVINAPISWTWRVFEQAMPGLPPAGLAKARVGTSDVANASDSRRN
jgi:hypothetical protein